MWDADAKEGEMSGITKALAREAVDSIQHMMEWARHVPDQYLDGDPEERRALVADRNAAKDVVTRLNAAIASEGWTDV